MLCQRISRITGITDHFCIELCFLCPIMQNGSGVLFHGFPRQSNQSGCRGIGFKAALSAAVAGSTVGNQYHVSDFTAKSSRPVYSLPLSTMPPPTPVPSVTISIFWVPFPAPPANSPSAAQLASLSIATVQEKSGSKTWAKHTLDIPRFVPNLSVQVDFTIAPGKPMPIRSISSVESPCFSHNVRHRLRMVLYSAAESTP